MDKRERAGFLLGCAVGFDLASDEIEELLGQYGLRIERDTLFACQRAPRDYVGETRWENGIRLIRLRATRSEWN